MYPKELFTKVLSLVDSDISVQFNNVPEELYKGENYPAWNIHDPLIMQLVRDLKKISQILESGVLFEKCHDCNDSTGNGCNG
jgi:hypothetical protein